MSHNHQPPAMDRVLLVASGDLRLAANQVCWSAQAAMEQRLSQAFAREGATLTRAHPVNEAEGHGFISSQRQGMDIFMTIDPNAPVVVAEAVWQYSHHVLAGLRSHRGPILTVANWSGQWPGLVGLLNLNGSLTKAGVRYSTLWSEDFEDAFFRRGLHQWLQTGRIDHDTSHARSLDVTKLPLEPLSLGQRLATQLRHRKAILGVFDEGYMGMYNAIIDDELLNPLGIYKERLSQSALVAEMRRVADEEARSVRRWQATTPQWPIMHAILHGVSRDQMMARHQANHIQVAYAPSSQQADLALAAKAAMFAALGVKVHLCGTEV